MQGGLLIGGGFFVWWRKGSPSSTRISIIVSSSSLLRACLGSVKQKQSAATVDSYTPVNKMIQHRTVFDRINVEVFLRLVNG